MHLEMVFIELFSQGLEQLQHEPFYASQSIKLSWPRIFFPTFAVYAFVELKWWEAVTPNYVESWMSFRYKISGHQQTVESVLALNLEESMPPSIKIELLR